jgi:hypothetical protein
MTSLSRQKKPCDDHELAHTHTAVSRSHRRRTSAPHRAVHRVEKALTSDRIGQPDMTSISLRRGWLTRAVQMTACTHARPPNTPHLSHNGRLEPPPHANSAPLPFLLSSLALSPSPYALHCIPPPFRAASRFALYYALHVENAIHDCTNSQPPCSPTTTYTHIFLFHAIISVGFSVFRLSLFSLTNGVMVGGKS